jgi:nicotinate-nucleotide pyrophosphorylase (carboxylating)
MSDWIDPPISAVREVVARALAEDLGILGDLTAGLVPPDATVAAALVARRPGVLAGRLAASEAFFAVDPAIEVVWQVADGAALAPGQVIARVEGLLRSVLSAERTVLNLLGHLSGIATLTRRYADAAGPGCRIRDTRKTTPGLRALEKAAVRAGGGHDHRANLSDAVLVKDNHLAGIGITEAVRRARSMWPGRMVEVECDRPEQVEEACRARATAVLLDNMAPEEAARCVVLARRTAGEAGILVEVSGRVSLDSARAYAAAGIDLLSVGALTHSAPVLDLGLDLQTED